MIRQTVQALLLGCGWVMAAVPVQAAEDVKPATEVKADAKNDAKVEVSKATAEAASKMTCRTVKLTGSNLRTRKVCSTPDSRDSSGDWLRQQQDRAGLNASAGLNTGG